MRPTFIIPSLFHGLRGPKLRRPSKDHTRPEVREMQAERAKEPKPESRQVRRRKALLAAKRARQSQKKGAA